MTDEHRELIASLRYNIQLLMSRYESERTERENLLAEFRRKHEELMHAHKTILELQQKYDNLKLAHSFAGSEEERKNADRRLSKMMREIDKCIALLNE